MEAHNQRAEPEVAATDPLEEGIRAASSRHRNQANAAEAAGSHVTPPAAEVGMLWQLLATTEFGH